MSLPRFPDVPATLACPVCGGYVRGHQWIGDGVCSIVQVFDEPHPLQERQRALLPCPYGDTNCVLRNHQAAAATGPTRSGPT